MSARPKLTKALLKKLESVADDGLTIKEVCAEIGIAPRTWRNWESRAAEGGLLDSFMPLAARVRAGMGSATDDMAWGVLKEVAEDPLARPSDRLAAAQAILRLRSTHKVEISGGLDIVTLAKLAKTDAG